MGRWASAVGGHGCVRWPRSFIEWRTHTLKTASISPKSTLTKQPHLCCLELAPRSRTMESPQNTNIILFDHSHSLQSAISAIQQTNPTAPQKRTQTSWQYTTRLSNSLMTPTSGRKSPILNKKSFKPYHFTDSSIYRNQTSKESGSSALHTKRRTGSIDEQHRGPLRL